MNACYSFILLLKLLFIAALLCIEVMDELKEAKNKLLQTTAKLNALQSQEW